jgi:hypothetical protein
LSSVGDDSGTGILDLQRKIKAVAIGSTIIGLIGVADTVWFYVTGSRSPIPSVAFTIGWPSFALYINFFVPGIVLGLGVRTRNDLIRIFGIVLSLVWIVAEGFSVASLLFAVTQAENIPSGLLALAAIAISSLFLGFFVWQFNVLRARETLLYFGG